MCSTPPWTRGSGSRDECRRSGRPAHPAQSRHRRRRLRRQLYEQAIRTLDDKRRVELDQQIDQAIWNLMPQVPLYQITGAYAVRSALANFGTPGLADVSYEDIGYTK